MKAVIRPEAEMKDTSIEWIGKIPYNWALRKINSLFETIGSGTTPNSNVDEYYVGIINWLQSGDINGAIVKSTKKHLSNEIVSNTSALTVYEAPFIAMAMYGASIGNVAIVELDACTNQACCVLSKPTKDIDMNFLFLGLMAAKEELMLSARGGGQPNISQNIIKQLRIAVPCLPEQQAIADYLDKTCTQIDEIITEAKASIEEYKKLKQAVIFEAVTKGLDKDAEMKDSGIEWIGKIPVDWVVKKFKYIATVNTNLVSPIGYEDYHQIAPDCIEKDSGKLIKERTVSEAGVESWNQLFKQGQLIYSKIRPTLNKVIIAPYDGLCSADMYPLDVWENIYFVKFVMLSKYFVGQVGLITQDRVKMPKINQEELANIYVVVPGKAEQQEIVDFLNKRTVEIESLISEKESLITDLTAYKKSLIYEMVTGKRRLAEYS